jgi:hypothetical protein
MVFSFLVTTMNHNFCEAGRRGGFIAGPATFQHFGNIMPATGAIKAGTESPQVG